MFAVPASKDTFINQVPKLPPWLFGRKKPSPDCWLQCEEKIKDNGAYSMWWRQLVRGIAETHQARRQPVAGPC